MFIVLLKIAECERVILFLFHLEGLPHHEPLHHEPLHHVLGNCLHFPYIISSLVTMGINTLKVQKNEHILA